MTPGRRPTESPTQTRRGSPSGPPTAKSDDRLHRKPIAQCVQPGAQHSIGELAILGVELARHVANPRVRALRCMIKRRHLRSSRHDLPPGNPCCRKLSHRWTRRASAESPGRGANAKPDSTLPARPQQGHGPAGAAFRSRRCVASQPAALSDFSHTAVALMRRRGSRPEADLRELRPLARGSSWASRR